MKQLIYDSSFDGFLTAVFTAYELKLREVSIVREHLFQDSFFGSYETITTDKLKADRVWKGLKQKTSGSELNRFYYTFLSEVPEMETVLFQSILHVFDNKTNVMSDFGNPYVLKLSKLTKNVSREKHRMEAFIRFKLTKDSIYFANIEPDFNVLPLIKKHFYKRYADQKWLIYDLKRNYGIYYDLQKTDIVNLSFDNSFDPTKTNTSYFADIELEFQQLWKDYFKSTNIKSRKNMKLHVQHVPKRYWKYLSEKQPY